MSMSGRMQPGTFRLAWFYGRLGARVSGQCRIIATSYGAPQHQSADPGGDGPAPWDDTFPAAAAG